VKIKHLKILKEEVCSVYLCVGGDMNYYSNIYWHFTGSPEGINWNEIYSPNDILKHGNIKPIDKCFEILCAILESKCLLATSNETIYDNLATSKFCCVTDIPIQNLVEHTKFYGTIAIGFKHSKIHREFNPVLYISPDKFRNKLEAITKPREVNMGLLGTVKFGDKGEIKDVVRTPFFNAWLSTQVDETQFGSYIFNYFKRTKFSDKTDESFYREREWRRIGKFEFEVDDISAIIAPSNYFEKINNYLLDKNLKNIQVLTWEFLNTV
jgi:abortive phage resistance protein AbiGi (putative antitoxin)